MLMPRLELVLQTAGAAIVVCVGVCWMLLRIPQCYGIKSSACCLLLLLGDAPG